MGGTALSVLLTSFDGSLQNYRIRSMIEDNESDINGKHFLDHKSCMYPVESRCYFRCSVEIRNTLVERYNHHLTSIFLLYMCISHD